MKKSILIVEDEAIISLMLQKNLESFDYNVLDIVRDGEQAIQKVKKMKPDLILMDVVIQGNMNGVEVAKRIKDISNVPVIFITGNSLDIISNEQEFKGCKVFSKPVLMNDLRKAISKVLS